VLYHLSCSREEDQKRNRQVCVLKMRQGKGWQNREIKLKKLKHEEGHIALGE
jgi:hypothetical protein